ncbi:hypothetical protein, partial [[Clostridium] symbiosum]|uniref:hypothetical protein n=1 Tax=Clostridium symbiosum TaxID=1512 RepID=UPI001FAA4C56
TARSRERSWNLCRCTDIAVGNLIEDLTKRWNMKDETITVDVIECPYCGRTFDGGEATNYDTTCDYITCRTCGGEIGVLQSVAYTCHSVSD